MGDNKRDGVPRWREETNEDEGQEQQQFSQPGSTGKPDWLKKYDEKCVHIALSEAAHEFVAQFFSTNGVKMELQYTPTHTLSPEALDGLMLYFIYKKHLLNHTRMKTFVDQHGASDRASELIDRMIPILYNTVDDLQAVIKQEVERTWMATFAKHGEEATANVRGLMFNNAVDIVCRGEYDPSEPRMQHEISELTEELCNIFQKSMLAYG